MLIQKIRKRKIVCDEDEVIIGQDVDVRLYAASDAKQGW